MGEPLRVFLVEDESLLLMQLTAILEAQGHIIAGTAISSQEAIKATDVIEADVALVDVHLADGPTGVEVAHQIVERTGMAVVFMTANPKRLPEDFPDGIGVIPKPYTRGGVRSALDYIEQAIRNPPPLTPPPRSLMLAPSYAQRWTNTET